jgi:hypothetical protein
MSAPTPAPLTTLAEVNRELSRPEDEEDAGVVAVMAAVNSLIPTWLERPAGEWPAHVRYGAALLAARIYRRKDSPGGTGGFGLEGGPGYVQSNWADVAMLLGLGSYAVGRVG